MGVFFQMMLVILNLSIMVVNYEASRFGGAMLNAGVAGFCLAMALSLAMQRRA